MMKKRNRKRMTTEQKQVRRSRRLQRWVMTPIQLVLLGLLGAGIGFGAYQVARFLFTSPTLAVRCIEVRGTVRTRVEDLLRAGGVEEGINIFSVDLDDVRERIVDLPWVRIASVSRVVPDNLIIEVEEYTPVAVVHLGGLYYVDANAEVFKRLQPGEDVDFPVLTGLSREVYNTERERTDAAIVGMLDLADAVRTTACLRTWRVGEVHHDELMGASVVLDPGALTVRLGTQNPIERLSALCRLLPRITANSLKAHTILLDHPLKPGWATVRLDGEKIANLEDLSNL